MGKPGFSQEFFWRLHTWWCFLLFCLGGVVAFLCFIPMGTVIFRNHPEQGLAWITWLYSRSWTLLTGVSFPISGLEKLKKKEAYILIGNHSSRLDFIGVAYTFRIPFRSLAKVELGRLPLFGYLFKKSCVLVDRSNPESRKKSLQFMRQVLDRGVSLLVFPEGTRNRTGRPLAHFYDGAFRTAVETGAPILPFVILEATRFAPQNRFLIKPGRVRMKLLDLIETKGRTEADIPALRQQVFELMWKEVMQADGRYADWQNRPIPDAGEKAVRKDS